MYICMFYKLNISQNDKILKYLKGKESFLAALIIIF